MPPPSPRRAGENGPGRHSPGDLFSFQRLALGPHFPWPDPRILGSQGLVLRSAALTTCLGVGGPISFLPLSLPPSGWGEGGRCGRRPESSPASPRPLSCACALCGHRWLMRQFTLHASRFLRGSRGRPLHPSPSSLELCQGLRPEPPGRTTSPPPAVLQGLRVHRRPRQRVLCALGQVTSPLWASSPQGS